ncbi:MAG TPA: penicillin-binding protein 2 [Verrucomicrobiae bacterium]
MRNSVPYRRLLTLAVLLVTAFCALGYRLVDLQVMRHDELRDWAKNNTQRRILLEPRRGEIRDVKGNLLASSVFVKTICADPTLLGTHAPEVARAIAPLLEVNESELLQRLQPRLRTNELGNVVTNRYVVLKRKVKVETWQSIVDTMADMKFAGIDEKALTKLEKGFYRNLRSKAIFPDVVDDQLRFYPNETLASHILGYVGTGEREVDGDKVIETTGIEGIERVLNTKLAGVRGWRMTETDRARREVVPFREQEIQAKDGLNVVLTIDAGIQHIVETELAEAMKKHTPISASAIVVRPRTGEILAMATLPTFNPNDPGASQEAHRRNRVITDMSEPGSTFKIVVVSGALNERLVTLDDRFDCENGRFYYAGKLLRDHHGYGMLSVEEIITFSSNIGSAKIAFKMGEQGLYDYVKGFGFGERTGIPLTGEARGIVHPVKNWNKLSISRIPMGHEVASTPLQMVMAMSAIANKGKLMRPMLVDRLEDSQGHAVVKYQPQMVRQAVSEEAAREMVTALKTVVSEKGTAAKAILEYYTVAGKTGTAQKPPYSPGMYFSSFIGFFPADNPELCISVVLDEPKNGYYGGTTAAPFFHGIAERSASYLNLRPEKPVPDQQFTDSKQKSKPGLLAARRH